MALAETTLTLLGRLLAGPADRRRARVAAVEVLLQADDGLTPDQLSRLGITRTETAALSRAGVCEWSASRGRWRVIPATRPLLTGLIILAGAPDPLGAQVQLLELEAATGGGDVALAGLVDLLAQAVTELDAASRRTPEEQSEIAQRLGAHAESAERALGALRDAEDPEQLERAVALTARMAGGVADILTSLARRGRECLPARRGGASIRELHAWVAAQSVERLSALVRAPGAPRARRLPEPALWRDRADRALAPSAAPPRGVVEDSPQVIQMRSDPDALGLADARIAEGAPADLIALIGGATGWAEALRLQQGLMRVHERAIRAGDGGLHVSGELIEDPHPDVARASAAYLRSEAVEAAA